MTASMARRGHSRSAPSGLSPPSHERVDLAEIGELARARELCEKLLSYASPLQLYAEEIDPRNGRHLGNFPQAFSHLALINAVMHVIRAESGESNRFTTAPLE